MTSLALKLLAVIAMLIDHIGHTFYSVLPSGVYAVMRITGRIAMPIFCFLIAEGLFHTKNVKKYLGRLLAFALLSEIPFDLMIAHKSFYFSYQNVYWTLFFGLLSIMLFDFFANRNQASLSLTAVLACAAAAFILRADYNVFGIYYIFVFYRFRGENRRIVTAFAAGVLIMCMQIMLTDTGRWAIISLAEMAALVPIALYNGRKGVSGRAVQFAFYAFYPVHMVLLYILWRAGGF